MSELWTRMRRRRQRAACRWLAATALFAGIAAPTSPSAASAGRPWPDPLDSPAIMSPLAARTQLLAVAQAGKRLVAVGWRGHIVVSEDQGASWNQVATPVSVDLTALQFTSPSLGWAVGHGGVILRTENGGLSWTVQLDGRTTAKAMVSYFEKRVAAGATGAEKMLEDVKLNTQSGAEQPWLDVHFIDATTGWVTGSFGMLMGTTDGGRTWSPQQEQIDNPGGLHLTSITSTDGDVYISSEQGIVFRKGVGEARFLPLKTGYTGTFFGVLVGRGSLIAFGLRGTAYHSADQGRTWTALKTGTSNAITAGTILADGRVVLATQAGELLIAARGESSFTRLQASRTFLFAGLAALNTGGMAIVGTEGAFVQPLQARTP